MLWLAVRGINWYHRMTI